MNSPFIKNLPDRLQAPLGRWLPPVMLDAVKRQFGSIQFHGDFQSWSEARAESEGFDSAVVLERVKKAALAVKNGEAAYERDSVTFKEKSSVWPVLAGLLWAASRSRGVLSVLDFGGSLGSTYYQHRSWLQHLERLRWSIVEQSHYVEAGRELFEDEHLRFFADVESAAASEQPNSLLISGALQYVEKPYEMLERLLQHDFDVILLDRTSLAADDRERLTVQRIGERIYPASFPAWFFSRSKLLAAFEHKYRVVESFKNQAKANISSSYEGFILERIRST